MEQFKLSIHTWKHIPGFYVYTNRGREHLLTVRKSNTSDDLWYFDIPENSGTSLFIMCEQFPVEHLLGLCKAVISVRHGLLEPVVELTVAAKKTLKIK